MAVPILMLHHVENSPPNGIEGWSINYQQFDLLIDCIKSKRLATITFEEIISRKLIFGELKNTVIITFDDCSAKLFDYAVPTLIKNGMKAVFYIPTAQIGGYNEWDVKDSSAARIQLMNAEQLNYLTENGMEVGTHGHHHTRLNSISDSDFISEITTSKETLEKLLKKEIFSLAYPYGQVPKKHKEILSNAGYRFGMSIYQPLESEFALRRIGIHTTDTRKSISWKLSQGYPLLRSILDSILYLMKRYKA